MGKTTIGSAFEADPSGIAASTPGAKLDNGKPRVALCLFGFLPALHALFDPDGSQSHVVMLRSAAMYPRSMEQVAMVTTKGAEKYTPNGWASVPNGVDRYLDAYGRHLLKIGSGEVYDNGPGGTGCLHTAQCVWNLLAALTLASIGHTPSAALESIGLDGLRTLTLTELTCLEHDLIGSEKEPPESCRHPEKS